MFAEQNSQPKVLITAGPTQEPLDSVRYLGNRSSGRMGLSLAEESSKRGFQTTLLLGPSTVCPPDPSQIHLLRFRTTEELRILLQDQWPNHDLLLMAAAVADFRPVQQSQTGKIRRSEQGLRLDLEPTPDLLASLGELTRPDQTVIGFALEAGESLISNARKKLESKHLDAIVVNPLETMDSDTVQATLLLRDGTSLSPEGEISKQRFAGWLFDQIEHIGSQSPGG